mgnify:FL=1|jgi:hypothetical protein
MFEYDVFVSHASADKENYVQELQESFKKLGIKIFYDADTIEWGDDWEQKIKNGLEKCRYGVIVVSKNFYNRIWTEKELKSFLIRQNNNGENVILPILYNTSIDELKKYCKKSCYKDLSKIQFVDGNKMDVKDITILLARKLLSSNKPDNLIMPESVNNKPMFDKFFEEKNSIDFYRWLDSLIKSNNQWSDGYPNGFLGWHLFKYNDKSIGLIQEQEDESNPYDDYINCKYRINPIYYSDFCKYFETYIRPQM